MQIRDAGSYFKALAERGREPRFRNTVGVWQLDIVGAGTWSVEVDRGVLRVSAGPSPAPTARVRLSERTFLRIVNGEGHENLLTSVLRGALTEVEGDIAFAQKLLTIMPLSDETVATQVPTH